MGDRSAIVKMIILPQSLYLFNTCPVWISKNWFDRLERIVNKFVWGRKRCRKKYSVLCLREEDGGMGLPDFRLYYYARPIDLIRKSHRSGIVKYCLQQSHFRPSDIYSALEAEQFSSGFCKNFSYAEVIMKVLILHQYGTIVN